MTLTSASGLTDVNTLTAMIVAPGATPQTVPAVPSLATDPAQCVPWPLSSIGSPSPEAMSHP